MNTVTITINVNRIKFVVFTVMLILFTGFVGTMLIVLAKETVGLLASVGIGLLMGVSQTVGVLELKRDLWNK